MAEHANFVWNELMTQDVEAAKRFYAEALGWTYEAFAMPSGPTYWIAKAGDRMVGGVMEAPGGAASSWVSYIEVDDVDARVTAATKKGAAVMRPPFDVDGVGRIAFLKDPAGALVAWITSVPRAG